MIELENGEVIEQRKFVLSSGRKRELLEVQPYEHNTAITPVFPPACPTLTKEMVEESLVSRAIVIVKLRLTVQRACAYILVPQLHRHLDLRRECTSSIPRTPEMNGERVTCGTWPSQCTQAEVHEQYFADRCGMSCLCGVRLCRFCGMEACDACMQEKIVRASNLRLSEP